MGLWVDCAERIGPGLVDPGKPLGNAHRVTTRGKASTESRIIGISILQAESMDDALEMVRDHHHHDWAEDCEMVVLEEMPFPEMDLPDHSATTVEERDEGADQDRGITALTPRR